MKYGKRSEHIAVSDARQDTETSTIVVQIGSERFAIHWDIEELPPAAPLLAWERRQELES
jgi:hypothetical protein